MQEPEVAKTDNVQERPDFLSSIMRGDGWIWGVYIFLVCISVVEIFSATSQLTYRTASFSDPAISHIRNLFLGAIALLFFQSMSLSAIRSWDKVFFVLGLVGLAASFFIGIEQKGATRSVGFFQPVELLKLGGIMVLCWAITLKDSSYHQVAFFRTKTRGRRFWAYLLIIFLAAGPIATQNLSSGLIIAMAAFGMMFLGKVEGKYLWKLLGVALIIGILALSALKIVYEQNKNVAGLDSVATASVSKSEKNDSPDLLIDRAFTWANRIFDHSDRPLWEEDMTGKKSQEIYSHMALANGTPWGRFIGNSKLRDFLPEAFSDYIYAIIFEEMGPLGAIFVLLLYLVLFLRCYLLSRRTQSPYIQLLMVGLPLVYVIQALIHIGVNTGAMFVTGQPLPLLSRGGSSIICTSAAFGVLLALSRIIRQESMEREQLAVEQETPIIELTVEQGLNEMQNNNNNEISD